MSSAPIQFDNGKVGSLIALHEWHLALGKAVSLVSSASFIESMIDALRVLVPIECAQFALEQKSLAPILLREIGIPSEVRSSLIGRYFASGYILDPLCFAVQSGLPQGFYHMSEVSPDDFVLSDYYKSYYLENGLLEDCYYIVDVGDAGKLTLCFYQGVSGGRFTVKQLDLLRSVEPIVRELIVLSYRLGGISGVDRVQSNELRYLSRNNISEVFDSLGRAKLTAREKDLAHLILRGHSTKSAANCLGVGGETIRMHRKNLYAKLKINSQAELFSMFISALPP